MAPLVLLAGALLPELLKLIKSPDDPFAATVARTVEEVTGTQDPVRAKQALDADPALDAQLKLQLGQLALEETKLRLEAEQQTKEKALRELEIKLADAQRAREAEQKATETSNVDRASARDLMQELARQNSKVAWVAPWISMIVVVGFFLVLLIFILAKPYLEVNPTPRLPPGVDWKDLRADQISALMSAGRSDFVIQIINLTVGTLTAALTTVLSFWLGSSQSSRVKDAVNASVQSQQVEAQTKQAEVQSKQVEVILEQRSAGGAAGGGGAAGTGGAAGGAPAKPADGGGAASPPIVLAPEAASDASPPSPVSEMVVHLTSPHRKFDGSVSWSLTPTGISIDGAPATGTDGEPTTVRSIWSRFDDSCRAAAKEFQVPVELIVATIATESGGRPDARRQEPHDISIGLMQTLVSTAREALKRPSLSADALFDPRMSIRAGTAYIAQQATSTHFDPPLVAAAYNAGSLRRDDGDRNRWKLHCFPKGTGQHIDRFVAWFADCMQVSSEQGWGAGGEVPSFVTALGAGGAAQAGLPGATAPVAKPAIRPSDPGFPPLPTFQPLRTLAEKQNCFGKFPFVADPQRDNPEHIKVTDDWAARNIVDVELPGPPLPGKSKPLVMQFHKAAREQLIGLWEDWHKEGLRDLVLSYGGSYAPRFIRGSRSVLSQHAFGSAFDINVPQNPLGRVPAPVGAQGSVRLLVPIAHRWGFFWGGHFANRLDGMHFEVAVLR